MPNSPKVPRLIELDPWLAPYQDEITARIDAFRLHLHWIESEYGSLNEFANIHRHLGIHFDNATQGWTCREWAPAAQSVALIGDFNQWDRQAHPLSQNHGDGVWEIQLPQEALAHQQRVKLHIVGADGSRRDRIPATIERAIQDPATSDFSGQVWYPPTPYEFKHLFKISANQAPLIYEAHIGMSGEQPRVHSYDEFRREILPRIAQAGYQAIQLMAIQEHPYYGSFGYHVSSFFAPSSRCGEPEQLKALIDEAHSLGIAVLLDIVHSHAVKNHAEGLAHFDGSDDAYFLPGEAGNHPQWDSKVFDYSKPAVQRFLLANLRYWLEEFQFDGFRFDGVTSMLYHHHGTTPFDHYDRYFRDGVNQQAIRYLQLATHLIKQLRPDAWIIAEDMSGMPGLCRPINEGGIGFTHRLAMGIPDFWIKLLKHQPDEQWNVNEIWDTLSNRRANEPTIAYAESHDQALVGDKTIAFRLMDQEMYWHMAKPSANPIIERGIALHKIIRLLTLAAGGEGYLNFMGNEFGHPEWIDFPREGNDWSYQYCRRQWHLLDNPTLHYQDLANFDQAMITLAKQFNLLAAPPAESLNFDQHNQVLVFTRAGLIFAVNLSVDRAIEDYRFPIPAPQSYQLLLDSDETRFGGLGRLTPATQHHPLPDLPSPPTLSIYLPNRTALVFETIR